MRIGIDVGGTKIMAGIVSSSGEVFYRKKIATEKGGAYEKVRKDIIGLVQEIMTEKGFLKGDVERIGIACAGQIDKKSKNIIFSPNLGWHNVPLKDDIEKAYGIETFIENDVNAATYGEWRFGLKGLPEDALGIFVGTGIGGGVIINRKLYRGYSNVGGEVGHIIVNPYGYKCHCGKRGCFEAYCGGSYVAERVKTEISGGYRGKIYDIIGGNVDSLNTGHIEEAALLDDALCKKIWDEVVEYAGAALAGLVNLLNPEIIILGGGVVYGSRYFIEETVAVMQQRAMQASLKGLKIVKAQLGEEAGIIGAAFVD